MGDYEIPTVPLPKLKKLDIRTTSYDISTCLDFLVIENLEELINTCTDVESARNITRYKKLKKLHLNDNAFVELFKDDTFRELECQLTSLETIAYFDWTRSETLLRNCNAFMKSQARSLTTLKMHIDLGGFPDVDPRRQSSAKVIATILGELRNLTVLHLTDNSRWSPTAGTFCEDVKPIESLKELKIGAMFWIGVTQEEFLKKFPNVEILIIDNRDEYYKHGAYSIKDSFLKNTSDGQRFNRLRRLGLEYLRSDVSDWEILLLLIRDHPNCSRLSI